MKTRNPKFTDSGAIDCEIEHPKFGWIPFTASGDDPEAKGRDVYAAITKAGGIAEYVAPVIDEVAQEAAALAAEAAEIDAVKNSATFKLLAGALGVDAAALDASKAALIAERRAARVAARVAARQAARNG